MLIVRIKKEGTRFVPYEFKSGKKVSEKIPYGGRKYAYENDLVMMKKVSKAGNVQWKKIKPVDIPADYKNPFDVKAVTEVTEESGYREYSDDEIRVHVANAITLKPDTLVLDELYWKLGVRASFRGDNILIIGYSGFGKTLTARTLATALKRPFFKFNMGATQDAKSSLIGNTHYVDGEGTVFKPADFAKAIQTPRAIILLDEITRMSEDAENIILPVLDRDQKYLRLDDHPDSPIVEVAEGVTFVATANFGAEFTSTRLIDRATKDRFGAMIEVPVLTEEQEKTLLKKLYPDINRDIINGIAAVAWHTRENFMSDTPDFTTMFSTRQTVEMIAHIRDGFTFTEVVTINSNLFDNEGGPESERAKIMQFAQGYSHLDNLHPIIGMEPEPEVEDEKEDVQPEIPTDGGSYFDTDDTFPGR